MQPSGAKKSLPPTSVILSHARPQQLGQLPLRPGAGRRTYVLRPYMPWPFLTTERARATPLSLCEPKIMSKLKAQCQQSREIRCCGSKPRFYKMLNNRISDGPLQITRSPVNSIPAKKGSEREDILCSLR